MNLEQYVAQTEMFGLVIVEYDDELDTIKKTCDITKHFGVAYKEP